MIKMYYDKVVEKLSSEVLKVDFATVKDYVASAVKSGAASTILEADDSPLLDVAQSNPVDTSR